MFFPSVEETLPVQNKIERGKSRVEEQESSNYELLSLLIEMRAEMNSSRKN